MMPIRPITVDELAAFAALTPAPDHRQAIHEYLTQQFAHGTMRPAWCFVIDMDGTFVGRLAYWASPTTGIPSDMLFFDVPWAPHDAAMSTQFLHVTWAAMRTLGATTLTYVLDTPPQAPQWQDRPDQRQHLLHALGFQVVRETDRFVHDHTSRPTPAAERLSFRSMPDVGRAAMLAAIEQVSVGTPDRLIQQQRTALGATGAAHTLLSILEAMTYDPRWWQLAYTPTGELIGLVLPTTNGAQGTIGYIGVVPAQRGHGYGYDLLTHGTALLHAAGIATIRADADVGNDPMATTFRRAGYTYGGTRVTYHLHDQG